MNVTRSMLAESLFYLNGEPFSLDDYKHMRPIYDSMHNSIVLQTSRQISKCGLSSMKVITSNGETKKLEELVRGDEILSFNEVNYKIILNKIKAVEDNGRQTTYYIKTETGRELEVTGEHPIWALDRRWVPAQDLKVGDFVGISVNNRAACPEEKTVPDHEYKLLSFLLSKEGSLENLDKFHNVLEEHSEDEAGHIKKWLKDLNLWGLSPKDVFFPDLFFKLDEEQIFNVLGIFWGTVENGEGVRLASKELVYGLQELLLRVGESSIISKTEEGDYIIKIDTSYFMIEDVVYDKIVEIKIHEGRPTTTVEMESPHNTLLLGNVVTHNSTTLANMMLANSIMYPGFKTLYVSPTVDQTKIFSSERVASVMEQSPYIKNHLLSSTLNQNVFTKQLKNRSKMFLRYALLSADRLRGISADACYFDECQDLLEEIIPVVQETMFRSMFKWSMFSGTPKTSTTFLAKLWRESTKNEWMVPCDNTGCKKWNYLDEKNLGDFGPICKYCGKPIDTKRGLWVTTGDPKAIHQGFRVNILMFADAPWVNWQRDIIDYRKMHAEGVFFNEKLGLEYDSGVKPITLDEIKACCTGGPMLTYPDPIIGSKPCYLGVDFGPTNSRKSNTVLVVLQNEGPKLRVVFAKKYLGAKASYGYIHEDIPRKYKTWGAVLMGSDYGLGEAPNAEIRKALGFEKVIAYQHVPNQKERSQWNPKMPAFTLNRTEVMGDYFQKIRHREIIFPRWEDFAPFAEDILNINTEYNETRGKTFYTNSAPDDFFQALVYGGETAIRHKLSTSEVY